MPGSSFQRPVGAMPDVKELEYISALHQTGDLLRLDGSIQDEDIRLFLTSRYGIDVDIETVRGTILHGLGCVRNQTVGSSHGEIDLMELTGILLIPTLLKASAVQQGQPMNEGLLLPPTDLIQFALSVVLHDCTGNHAPKRLTVQLLQKIFEAYGELEYSADKDLLQEMVDCCHETGSGSVTYLTAEVFGKALTYDVSFYDYNNEVRESTHLQDVFKASVVGKDSSHRNEGDALASQTVDACSLKRKATVPAIDFTAGTYRSKSLAIMIWATTLITFFVDVYSEGRQRAAEVCSNSDYDYVLSAPWRSNKGAVACETGLSIILWLFFFAAFSIYGLGVVGLGSIGNHVYCKRWWVPLIGAIFVLLATVPGFIDKMKDSTPSMQYLSMVAFSLGLAASAVHILHAASMIVPKQWKNKYEIVTTLLKSSTILGELDLKKASARKIHGMLVNAIEIVEQHEKESILNTHFSQALFNFSKNGIRRSEEIGGMRWAWRNLFNRKLFRKEGLWYSVRLSASNLAQAFISLYILIEGSRLIGEVDQNFNSDGGKEDMRQIVDRLIGSNADEALVESLAMDVGGVVSSFLRSDPGFEVNCSNFSGTSDSIIQDYCSTSGGFVQCDDSADINYLCGLLDESSNLTGMETLGLLNASGLDSASLLDISRNVLQQSVDETIDSLYPAEKYMVTIPLVVALCAASICALYLTLSYFSSVTSTVLKLRCGIIPSLMKPEFARMRVAPDTVSLLTGSMFWGCLGSSLLVGGFVGLIVFLFLWQGSVYFAQRATALFIGIIIVTLIRLCLVRCCRKSHYKAFYRERPAAANVTLLALEWANFALSAGFILIRAIKLILVAGFSIGRVDKPFLAEGVGMVGQLELDGYPTIHTRDLLLSEAHRHPYLELLGTMYLMKLRYSDHFGKTAGSCWRLIFVYALFPWLHRYRVMARPALFEDTSHSYNSSSSRERDLRNKSLHYLSLRNMFACVPEAQADDEKSAEPSDASDSSSCDEAGHSKRAEIESNEPRSSDNEEDKEDEEVARRLKLKELKQKISDLQAEMDRVRQE